MDLRTNGSIYPKDPLTNATPAFANITNLLHFTGNEKDDLLGYAQHLEMQGLITKKERDLLAMQNMQLKKLIDACQQKISSSKETIQSLEKEIRVLREKDTLLGRRKKKRELGNIETLKIGKGGMKKCIRALR